MASGFAAASAGGSATAEDLLAASDIGPCELVQGTLVMMSPAGFEHGVITQRIAAMLHAYVAARKLGVVTAAETGFLLARSPDTVRAADVAFVAEWRCPQAYQRGGFLCFHRRARPDGEARRPLAAASGMTYHHTGR